MHDIHHEFTIAAPSERVFEGVATPAGLDAWWTLASTGEAAKGATWSLDFGGGCVWEAIVTRHQPGALIEYEFTRADDDWVGTRVALELAAAAPDSTRLRFRHTGWRERSGHFRSSSFCWALYLRILKRYLEHGETVPYGQRLSA